MPSLTYWKLTECTTAVHSFCNPDILGPIAIVSSSNIHAQSRGQCVSLNRNLLQTVTCPISPEPNYHVAAIDRETTGLYYQRDKFELVFCDRIITVYLIPRPPSGVCIIVGVTNQRPPKDSIFYSNYRPTCCGLWTNPLLFSEDTRVIKTFFQSSLHLISGVLHQTSSVHWRQPVWRMEGGTGAAVAGMTHVPLRRPDLAECYRWLRAWPVHAAPRDYYMLYDTFMNPAQKVARSNLITISMTVGPMCSQAKRKLNKTRSNRYIQFMTL